MSTLQAFLKLSTMKSNGFISCSNGCINWTHSIALLLPIIIVQSLHGMIGGEHCCVHFTSVIIWKCFLDEVVVISSDGWRNVLLENVSNVYVSARIHCVPRVLIWRYANHQRVAGRKGIYIMHYTEKTVETDTGIGGELFDDRKKCSHNQKPFYLTIPLALCYFVFVCVF